MSRALTFAIKAWRQLKCVIGKNHIRRTSEVVQAKFSYNFGIDSFVADLISQVF
ncbi:hypothetical protein GCM10011391_15030 [Pullulanibacillus camelliae]|uniref:Transposase n=1 Tax=Pullulanibacillus camelliae TaxID=1707096 RepID=A0A8J2YCJ8_9BACL|nr:hypothetical protein GCM10011391_15030 [Pullulanibacillus camelliae]